MCVCLIPCTYLDICHTNWIKGFLQQYYSGLKLSHCHTSRKNRRLSNLVKPQKLAKNTSQANQFPTKMKDLVGWWLQILRQTHFQGNCLSFK